MDGHHGLDVQPPLQERALVTRNKMVLPVPCCAPY